MIQIAFPFHIDGRHRTALASPEEHVRQLMEQILLTAPGERVNRPSFGSGLLQMAFAPNSNEVASALQMLAQGALAQWLSDLVQVDSVVAEAQDSTLRVIVRYTVRQTGQIVTAQFARPL